MLTTILPFNKAANLQIKHGRKDGSDIEKVVMTSFKRIKRKTLLIIIWIAIVTNYHAKNSFGKAKDVIYNFN